MEFSEETICPHTHFIEIYDPVDLGIYIKVTKIYPYSFIKVLLMMILCQYGPNLAIGSEDRMQTRLSHDLEN